jgi:hypothetical protein
MSSRNGIEIKINNKRLHPVQFLISSLLYNLHASFPKEAVSKETLIVIDYIKIIIEKQMKGNCFLYLITNFYYLHQNIIRFSCWF